MTSCHVVTFADSSHAHMHVRFRRQARKMRLFENIYCWTEGDLDPGFVERFARKLEPSVRGFGYFVWKPQVILQALKKINDGDALLYVDSGSHLISSGRERFMEYVDTVSDSESGILAFQLTLDEAHWTKGDLLDHFGVRASERKAPTKQVQAGAILIHKRPKVENFFLSWLELFESNFDLVDDTPSLSPNLEGFVAHRHDQSVFSLLAKQEHIELGSAAEQYPSEVGVTWKDLGKFPIHHRRDKLRKREALRRRIKEAREPIDLVLMRTKRALLSLFN